MHNEAAKSLIFGTRKIFSRSGTVYYKMFTEKILMSVIGSLSINCFLKIGQAQVVYKCQLISVQCS